MDVFELTLVLPALVALISALSSRSAPRDRLDMSSYGLIARARDQLNAVRESTGLDRLEHAKLLRETADQLEQECALAAREAGAGWTDIGALYKATSSAVARRFSRSLRRL